MNFTIKYHYDVKKDLKKISKKNQQFIKRAIETRLAIDPVFFWKPLQYSLSGCRSMRVGDYRIIFQVEMKNIKVLIIKIGHRRDISKG